MAKKIDKSVQKIKDLEQRLKAEHETRVRLAADLHNLEKRTKEERQQFIHQTRREFLERLFPVVDNFYRASQHAPQVSLEDLPKLTEEDFKRLMNYFEGLRLIERQLEQVLAHVGLRRVPTVGAHFDPHLHEAMSYESNSEFPPDTVIAEVESGWKIGDQVAKVAKVRVSKGFSATTP